MLRRDRLARIRHAEAHPDALSSRALWKEYGIDPTNTRARKKFLETTAWQLELHEACAPDRTTWMSEQAASVWRPKTEVDRFERAAAQAVFDLLRADEVRGLLAALDAIAAELDDPWPRMCQSARGRTAIEWERLARLARAEAVRDREAVKRVWSLLTTDVSDQAWASRADPMHLADMPAVVREETVPGVPMGFGRLPARRDVRAIQRTVWAFLRDPERATRLGGGHTTPTRAEPVDAVVEATHEGFADWLAHASDQPGFAHVTLERRRAPREHLVAEVTSRVTIRARTVTVRVQTDLGPSTPGSVVGPERLAPLGGAEWEWFDIERHGAPAEPLDSGLARSADTSGITTPSGDRLLGEDACDHPGAEWHVIDTRPPRFARLACPACLRTRAAVMPLHRMHLESVLITHTAQDDFATTRTYPRRLAHWRHVYARHAAADDILAGGVGAVLDFDALRARDGACSLDPADYASRAPRRVPTRRSAESLLTARRDGPSDA